MSEKVLLVDDEEEYLDTLAERMRNRGMDVETTTSAEVALKKADTGSYDAIVLDLMMPGMDGLQVLRVLKKKNPDIQVILLTGYATLSKGIEAMKLGALDFIEKPADIKILTDKIKEAQAQKMLFVEKKMEKKMKKLIQKKSW